jgi:hypothetical protein
MESVCSDFMIAEMDEGVNVLGDHALLITVRKDGTYRFSSTGAFSWAMPLSTGYPHAGRARPRRNSGPV